MALIQFGKTNNPIYQTERPLTMNPDGSGQASITYKTSVLAALTALPAYLSPHPIYPELKCYETTTDLEPGGVYRVTSTYMGVVTKNPQALAQHEFSRSTSEAPIETHPKFSIPYNDPPVTPKQLAIIELALQNAQPPPSSITGPAKILYNKKVRGIESYLKPGGVYKKSYVSDRYPSEILMKQVGRISSPPSPAPGAPSNQQYLCIGISWVKQAGVITISEEHQLSGPGGWDPDLYHQE